MSYKKVLLVLVGVHSCYGADERLDQKHEDLFRALVFREPVAAVQEHIEYDQCDPNYMDHNGLSVLALAAFCAPYKTVLYLLQKGAKVNPQNQWMSALCAAVEACRPDIVALLDRYGADITFESARCEINLGCYTLDHLENPDTADAQRQAKQEGKFQILTALQRAQLRRDRLLETDVSGFGREEKKYHDKQLAGYCTIIGMLTKK